MAGEYGVFLWEIEYGVFLWEIEYGVLPKSGWPPVLGPMAFSPSWASYVTFAVASAGTRVHQSGVGLVRFDAGGLATEFREFWHTRPSGEVAPTIPNDPPPLL